jgi:hypothetical protein
MLFRFETFAVSSFLISCALLGLPVIGQFGFEILALLVTLLVFGLIVLPFALLVESVFSVEIIL